VLFKVSCIQNVFGIFGFVIACIVAVATQHLYSKFETNFLTENPKVDGLLFARTKSFDFLNAFIYFDFLHILKIR
jgi:hypothetical protein